MTFLDDQVFPVKISQGSIGGPDWPADIVTLASGREERNTSWSAPLRSYDAKYGVRTRNELYEILELYYVAMGRLKGFRLLDWTDYRSGPPHTSPTPLDQPLGTGDAETTEFQLSKQYIRGGHVFARTIRKPFGDIRLAVDGVELGGGWSVDVSTGRVTFDTAPDAGAEVTWGGQFHVPVRFDTRLELVSVTDRFGDIPSILLKEIRL